MEDDEKLKEERAFAVKTREKTSKSSGGQSVCPSAGTQLALGYLITVCSFDALINQPLLKTPSRTPPTSRAMLLGQQGFHVWTTFHRWLT